MFFNGELFCRKIPVRVFKSFLIFYLINEQNSNGLRKKNKNHGIHYENQFNQFITKINHLLIAMFGRLQKFDALFSCTHSNTLYGKYPTK